jgi:hypothetical protein
LAWTPENQVCPLEGEFFSRLLDGAMAQRYITLASWQLGGKEEALRVVMVGTNHGDWSVEIVDNTRDDLIGEMNRIRYSQVCRC